MVWWWIHTIEEEGDGGGPAAPRRAARVTPLRAALRRASRGTCGSNSAINSHCLIALPGTPGK